MPNPHLKDNNFFSVAAIPGQSLTDIPGNKPYERPPTFPEPERAFGLIAQQLRTPVAEKSIVGLLDAGVSAETISSSVVMQAFMEGHITPDVAELIKEPLVRIILRIGLDNGVEDMNVINELPEDGMSTEDSLELMRQLNPTKYKRQMDRTSQARESEEMDREAMLREMDAPEEPVGFIDREGII
tara:strand:+ start:796 stop:1350 length:555 start_codon:yes stop_codon:yes gene_type:complete